jgi:hypothetical protein
MPETTDWVEFACKRAQELADHGRLSEAVTSFVNDLRGRPGVPAFNDAELRWALALQGKPQEPAVRRFLEQTAARLKGASDGKTTGTTT